jgi:hypothetical protein
MFKLFLYNDVATLWAERDKRKARHGLLDFPWTHRLVMSKKKKKLNTRTGVHTVRLRSIDRFWSAYRWLAPTPRGRGADELWAGPLKPTLQAGTRSSPGPPPAAAAAAAMLGHLRRSSAVLRRLPTASFAASDPTAFYAWVPFPFTQSSLETVHFGCPLPWESHALLFS